MTLSGPGGAVSGDVDYDSASRKATFTPSAALAASTTYTVNVSGAKDLADNTMSPVSWTFTTAAASSGCPCTIWPSSATPAVAADPDNGGIEVGVKFRTTQAGTITGIRFYKGTGNTGTHVGSLWTRTGTKLASVTFTGESSSGWQQATFATPVAVAPTRPTWRPITRRPAITRCPRTTSPRPPPEGRSPPCRTGPTESTASTDTAPQRIPTLGLSIKQLLGRRRPDDELATTIHGGHKLNAFIARATRSARNRNTVLAALLGLALSFGFLVAASRRSRPRRQPARARSLRPRRLRLSRRTPTTCRSSWA